MADLWSNSLQRLVDRIAGGEVGESAFKKSVYMNRLWKKKKVRSGERIEVPLITGSTGTATMFTVYGTGDSSVTYAEPDKHINLVSNWKPGGDTIRLSKIRLAQAAGMKDRLYDYVEQEVKVTVNGVRELWGNQLINGLPSTTATDFDGLEAMFTTASGGSAVTWLSQARNQSDALYPAIFNAQSTAAAYTTGTVSGSAGARTITGSGTTWTTNAYPGDTITIDGDTTTYTIRAVISNTSIEVTPKLAAAASGDTYSIAHAFNNTTKYGESGETNLKKINKAYYGCVDGSDHPTLALMSAGRFNAVADAVIAQQRFTGAIKEVGMGSHETFNINQASAYVDNYTASDRIYLINEDYDQLFALPGFDSLSLDKGSLKDNHAGDRRASLTGELNVVLTKTNQAPNRSAMLYNLND